MSSISSSSANLFFVSLEQFSSSSFIKSLCLNEIASTLKDSVDIFISIDGKSDRVVDKKGNVSIKLDGRTMIDIIQNYGEGFIKFTVVCNFVNDLCEGYRIIWSRLSAGGVNYFDVANFVEGKKHGLSLNYSYYTSSKCPNMAIIEYSHGYICSVQEYRPIKDFSSEREMLKPFSSYFLPDDEHWSLTNREIMLMEKLKSKQKDSIDCFKSYFSVKRWLLYNNAVEKITYNEWKSKVGASKSWEDELPINRGDGEREYLKYVDTFRSDYRMTSFYRNAGKFKFKFDPITNEILSLSSKQDENSPKKMYRRKKVEKRSHLDLCDKRTIMGYTVWCLGRKENLVLYIEKDGVCYRYF